MNLPDNNVRFMLNVLYVPSQSCTKIVYNRSSLLGLRNSNTSKHLSGVTLTLEPEELEEVGILQWPDPGVSKVVVDTETQGSAR